MAIREHLPGLFVERGLGHHAEAQEADYRCVAFAMVINSINPIATHQTRDCSWCEVMLVCSLLSCLVLNPLTACFEHAAFGTWPLLQSLEVWEAPVMLAGALCLFLNMAFEIRGYQLAKPGKAAMFVYMEVPFAYLLQCLRAQHAVQLPAVIGSCLIIASSFIGTFAQLTALDASEEGEGMKERLGFEGLQMEASDCSDAEEAAAASPTRMWPLKGCPRVVSLQSAE